MGAEYAAKKFNLNTPVVCYQGAVVRTKNEILWQATINNNIATEIVDYLRKKNIHTHIYNDDTLYVEDDNKRIMDEYCNGRGTTYKYIKSFNELSFKNIPKILGVIENDVEMQKIKKELKEKYKGILTIVQSAKNYLEITDIKASKGSALNFLKKYWNLSDDEVIAFIRLRRFFVHGWRKMPSYVRAKFPLLCFLCSEGRCPNSSLKNLENCLGDIPT